MLSMVDIFEHIVFQCLVINIDDIIICYRTCEEYVRDLNKVLQTLEEQNLYWKKSKCKFFSGKLEILIHILISERLYIDRKKRKTILEYPATTNEKDLRGVLEVVNYLQAFLPGLASDTSTILEL